MRAPISVVIPTLQAGDELAPMLASLTEGVSAGLIREVIVSDGGSTDATRVIADAAGARWIAGAPGRGGQLQRGCASAAGAWLMVLHSDSRLSAGWAVPVREALDDPDWAHVFHLRYRAKGVGPAWVAGWANLRTRLFGLPYGDQGLLIARPLYDAAGGYPDVPLMEDVALVRALSRAPRLMASEAQTSFARYAAEGWLRRGARNLLTYARYRAGVPPERLAKDYARTSSSRK